MARQTVPLPPARETPPRMTAVRAWNSQRYPVVESVLF